MGNTNTGKAYVEVLADGKLRVGSEDIIGTIPGCIEGDEAEVSCPVLWTKEPQTRMHPGCDEMQLDGAMQVRILRNGQPLREMDAAEAEAFGVIIGTMLDDSIILDASENWPEPRYRGDED